MASLSQSVHAHQEWTPRSGDLVAELPELVRAMRDDGDGDDGFTVRRVMFNPADWNSGLPRSSTVEAGGRIKLGAFHYQQRGTVTVISDDGQNRVTLRLPAASDTT
ncbi:hypothetical protein GCM10027265_04970 [Jatrophihabitans fulvus]